MPRTAQEILDNADELAARFSAPNPAISVTRLHCEPLAKHFWLEPDPNEPFTDAVVEARHDGHSWASIGAMVGTSGEAARQRYGQAIKAE